MDICKSKSEYIRKVAPAAQKACKRYGYLPSVLIAQSCLENGYGVRKYWDNPEIEALMKYNNMVGIKSELLNKSWTDIGYSVWNGQSLKKNTPETYGNNNVTIKDNFRKYESIEQSFVDFLLFITYASNDGAGGKPKYGPEVINIKDPSKLIKEVHKRGYATGKTYSDNVIRIIEENNLTQYDDLQYTNPTNYIPKALKEKLMKQTIKIGTKKINDITQSNLSQVPKKRTEAIKYIVIHYLGVPNADNPYLYGGGKGGHYNIKRNGEIYKAADPKTAVVWHCGGELQGSGGHTFYGKCTNANSIGIENGVCYTKNVKEGDGDSNYWYFTEETQESLVWLVSKLMDEYNIPIDRVIRHYDVTGKICPNPYVKNNKLITSWTWDEFKANVKQYRKDGTITITGGNPSVATEIQSQDLTKGCKGEAVKTMQQLLIKAGYSCGSAGADGVFGNDTLKALKNFQREHGLSVDGIYGPVSKAKLEAVVNPKKASDITVSQFLKSAKNVMNTARTKGYKYGDSHAADPTTDKLISCDRLIAKALYDLGFKDQRVGGETCGTLDNWLKAHGFKRSTKTSDIKKGSILLVKHAGYSYISHAFIIVSYNSSTWVTSRYDAGSNERIQTAQPLKNVSWGYRKDDVIVYNIPGTSGTQATTGGSQTTDKQNTTKTENKAQKSWKAVGTATATVDDLNVREEPSNDGKILRKLNKGNRFEIDGKMSGNWYHVNVAHETIGWIYGKYVKKD